MGETMSKRLRLHLGAEAEMEERAFPNRFPDYEAAASADAAASAAAEDTDGACPAPAPDELGLPFHDDGKVSGGRQGPGLGARRVGGARAVVASTRPAHLRAGVTGPTHLAG